MVEFVDILTGVRQVYEGAGETTANHDLPVYAACGEHDLCIFAFEFSLPQGSRIHEMMVYAVFGRHRPLHTSVAVMGAGNCKSRFAGIRCVWWI